ncbi:hypothetical protein BGY98DRAFT_983246, partial [Russula aff. rugulosa BPL654]
MTSTTPFALHLLLVFAKDESALSRCPLRACLPLLVWPTGPAGSELAKSMFVFLLLRLSDFMVFISLVCFYD